MIKGKAVKKKQSPIKCLDSTKLPNQILNKHSRVHLMVDYMFVQGIQFLTTISHELQFRTVEALPITYKKGAKKGDILTGLLKVINLYRTRGLEVIQIYTVITSLNVLERNSDPYS